MRETEMDLSPCILHVLLKIHPCSVIYSLKNSCRITHDQFIERIVVIVLVIVKHVWFYVIIFIAKSDNIVEILEDVSSEAVPVLDIMIIVQWNSHLHILMIFHFVQFEIELLIQDDQLH